MVYFISRHAGAIEWMKQQGDWQVDRWVAHLEMEEIAPGDKVLGTLPVHLAAEVCAKGAEFYFLQLPQNFAGRGTEYSAEEMVQMGCRLTRYEVFRVPSQAGEER